MFTQLRLVLLVLVAISVVAGAGSLPAVAAPGADIAVELRVVDDRSDPQVFGVSLRNNGPDTAEYPSLMVDSGGQELVDHGADPLPGSRDDGVGCTTGPDQLSCSWDVIDSGGTVDFLLYLTVVDDAELTAMVESAGTPDPNPTANNRDRLLLRPAVADLAVTAGEVEVVDGLARVEVTVSHVGGRETAAELTVDGDLTPHDTPGCDEAGDGLHCALGGLRPGDTTVLTFQCTQPEPGEDVVTMTFAVAGAELTDPDPSNDVVEVVVAPRDRRPADVRRHQGVERVRTAVAISRAQYPEGSRSAVLARADGFADALAGAPLAVDVDGPILLSPTGQLADATADELSRLLRPGATVHLLGGVAALDEPVADAVAALGYRVRRHAGANRYATSAVIADAIGTPREVAFADGDDFPDAVVAGAAMAARGGALLLTSGTRLPDETAGFAARADWAVGRAASRAVPRAEDLAGTTGPETSAVVAEALFPTASVVGVATTAAFPDALAGGPLVATHDGPMLLSDPDRLSSVITSYLSGATTIDTAHLFGGPGALSATVEDQLLDLLAR